MLNRFSLGKLESSLWLRKRKSPFAADPPKGCCKIHSGFYWGLGYSHSIELEVGYPNLFWMNLGFGLRD